MWIEIATGKTEHLPLANPCSQIVFARDGTKFAAVFEVNATVLDMPTGKRLANVASGRPMLFFPNGQLLGMADE